ncbi:MAG: DAK2 domain-containing protein [Lachnospiraceae bacterium]|nr:DAK2 domain-containing protein [Lachnospiraceae bacterium]
MIINTIDATMLQKCFLAGAKSIEAKKEYINELNVFPVPDGDTGTNMCLTIMSASNEVSALVNPTMAEVCKAISSGSLRGARGNSGVILSQLFRGFTKEIKTHDEIDVSLLSNAFYKAVETAYKAVMKPKEGTILTVAKGGAERAMQLVGETDNIVEFSEKVLDYMNEVLQRTPDMLPVLKEAGVVDSGGQGLLEILTGCYNCLIGKEIVELPEVEEQKVLYAYKAEFIINVNDDFILKDKIDYKQYLESIGEVNAYDMQGSVVNVSINTNDPGLAITKAISYGTIDKVAININEGSAKPAASAAEKPKASEPAKQFGFISVSIGEGINNIFKDLGVDYIIEGGQTMNPSTEDMLNAIENVNAENIFILPNNGNIILTAQQAKSIVEDKNILVVPTKNVPQGITSLITFIPDMSAEENLDAMTEAIGNVKSGQVTYAVRDTNMDGKEIKQGDIMGIGDKVIQSVGSDINTVTAELIDSLVDSASELISIYYGADIIKEAAEELLAAVSAKYPSLEVELNYGGQPIYYYVLSVE